MPDRPALSDRVLDHVERMSTPLQETVPKQFGPEPGAEKLTEQEELDDWDAVALDDAGMPLDEGQVELEYMQKAMQGEITPDLIPALVSRKLYPLRYEMIRRSGATMTEQAAYAEKTETRAAKRRMSMMETVEEEHVSGY